MTNLYNILRWKYLLSIFKIKRIVRHWYGVRKLDYPKKELYIITNTLREYQTRSRSVAKEPQTVAWLEKIASVDSILYDVGANIGAYSLIAGALGMRVFAFEPAFYNTATFEENILLNNLASRISLIPIALGEEHKLGSFLVTDPTSGSSRGFYNKAGFFRHDTTQALSRDVLVLPLDQVQELFNLPVPTALKIDVDGGELEVLRGATRILALPTVQSVLVEVDTVNCDEVLVFLEQKGFLVRERIVLDASTENIIAYRL